MFSLQTGLSPYDIAVVGICFVNVKVIDLKNWRKNRIGVITEKGEPLLLFN